MAVIKNLSCTAHAAEDNCQVQIRSTELQGEFGFVRVHSIAQVFLRGSSEALEIPVASACETEAQGTFLMRGQNGAFSATSTWTERQSESTYLDATLHLVYTGCESVDLGVRVQLELVGGGEPRWMIPGAFYKENRFEHNTRMYPRYDYRGGDPQQLVSDYWSFRADRAALPAVFAWNEELSAALCVDETSMIGLNGIGFSGNARGTFLWADFPYREEPVVFDGEPRPQPADIQTFRMNPGDSITFTYRIYIASKDLHSYNPFLRTMYGIHKQTHHLNPWMGLHQAMDLTAHGLYRWHFDPAHDILRETAAFDRELNNNVKNLGDRPHMHVAWVSGAPYAYALLVYGRRHGVPDYVDAALRVLDKVASGIAPNGTFWAEWTEERGWGCGWNPRRDWLQARTIAEATMFMTRAVQFERQQGESHPAWEAAVLSNLRFATRVQRDDGNFGSYYQCDTGNVEEWDGAGGILWIAALVEGDKAFPAQGFREAASKGGCYYSRFVQDEFIYGAPEDVHLTPTSEDAYNAVVAYVLLFEQDASQDWLSLAKSAADWMMTFRWTYNLQFPPHSLLSQYDFKSRGADQASPSNQHLHNYGLFCLPEVMRLWTYTKDDYYLHRTRDLLSCFLQFIAREDGDFNAYKGMVTERYYNTHCFQPKGMMVTLSHAWCVGVTLYACQEALAYESHLTLQD